VIHEFNGASFSCAVFNLSTTIVGAGIMALPASIKMLGLIPGILMIILVRCSHQGKITSYGWLMGQTFGEWGRIVLQASVVINNAGVLIVYMIIIGMLLNNIILYARICILLNITPI
jgi:solute carrier family 38 (sodium-coupled neutral amino acid transporter), member 2